MPHFAACSQTRNSIGRRARLRWAWFLACGLMPFAGCGGETANTDAEQSAPFEGVALTVAVVGDSDLATPLNQLRDEWNAQTGSSFTVKTLSEDEFLAQSDLGADVAIVPSYLAGIVKQREWTTNLSASLLNNPQLNWRDILPDLRTFESGWNRQTVGVPLGSPRLLLVMRADLLRALDREPPQTWNEYYELAAEFADANPALQTGAAEPNSQHWPGLMFLAKAASVAKHRDYFSSLFDIESMEPQIANAPFVQTLQAWVNSADGTIADQNVTPEMAYGMVRSGAAAMAMTWPAATWNQAERAPDAEIMFAPLPGSQSVFVPGEAQGQSCELRQVSLTSFGGFVGVVSAAAENQNKDASWQLLMQVAGDGWGAQVGSASPEWMMSRESQTADAARWLPAQDSAAVGSFAAAMLSATSADDSISALPLPGRDRYLSSLSAGVRKALSGEQTAEQALQEVAQTWSQITEELGLDEQRQHYRASVTHGY